MKRFRLFLVISFLVNSFVALAQVDEEEYLNSLLREEVKVENPVYKPVLGFGMGILNFHGDVNNNNKSATFGTPAFRLNVATFLDNKHYFKTNFALIVGTLSGNERSLDTASIHNRNFSSDIISFGLNVHYDFRHFIKKSPVRPFVSLGLENISFNSKTDLTYNDGARYNYWSDGTIRDINEKFKGTLPSKIINRDYKYETDLRSYNGGNYSQNTFGIPLDIGVDFAISDRVNLRVGQSYHYTFSQNIDGVNSKNGGNGKNDMFTMSYFTLHLDLFSDAKTKIIEKLFAEVDFDYAMFGDEDNDGVRDLMDKCFGTPPGVKVDSVGCPLDGDRDGVPDYLDKDPHTRLGAMVDNDGVEIDKDKLASSLNVEAINRKEVEVFLMMRRAQNRYGGRPSQPIPSKFKTVDRDGDGYISFDELLKAIDDFFDFSSELTSKDIYELQDFFFEQ
jgi:hypothetical protein